MAGELRCACPCDDARECYLRGDTPAICDDDELELELDQNFCECPCHDDVEGGFDDDDSAEAPPVPAGGDPPNNP